MNSHYFRDALDRGEPIVLDGGLATQLESQGNDISDKLWSARLLMLPISQFTMSRAVMAAPFRVRQERRRPWQ